jgi:hypothetical protein
VAAEAAQIYVFDRLPHHLAPLSLSPNELAWKLGRFGLLSAAMIALWGWLRRREPASPAAASNSPEIDASNSLERIMRFAAFALAASAAGLLIEAALTAHPAAAARVLRYYWFRQADVYVPLAVGLAVAHLVLSSPRVAAWQTTLGVAAAVWCVGELGLVAYHRWQKPIPPADMRIARERMSKFQSWQDACHWIRRNTPPDACFLIPRAGQSFKWHAHRADVVNWKDVPQDARNVVEWRKRYEEVFPLTTRFGEEELLDSPEKLGAEKVRQLADKFGATHVVARAYPPLDLPLIYANEASGSDRFVVYRIPDDERGDDP